jgi:hypothetical protein
MLGLAVQIKTEPIPCAGRALGYIIHTLAPALRWRLAAPRGVSLTNSIPPFDRKRKTDLPAQAGAP